ncbi:MAG TPA: hypothetical protein VJ461_06910 [Candidatus Nanoarchaeia archaeon]|nr:hypothetical protein [Candidatus Nanoarchaeia archaeon]
MKALSRKKKGDTQTTWIIISIILGLIVFALFVAPQSLPAQVRNLFNLHPTVVSPYEACHGLDDGDACAVKDYSGICKDGMCVKEDIAAYSLEEAIQLFQTTLKQNLESCKKDGSGCDAAEKTIDNILSYIDDDGESKVDILFVKYDNNRTDVILRRNKKILIFFPAGKKESVSFRFVGNTCFMKDSTPMTEKEWNKAGIRRGSNGLQVFRIANEGATRGDGIFQNIIKSDNGICVSFTGN